MSNIYSANYLDNEFNTFKKYKNGDICKIINREISFNNNHLVETSFSVYFFDKYTR